MAEPWELTPEQLRAAFESARSERLLAQHQDRLLIAANLADIDFVQVIRAEEALEAASVAASSSGESKGLSDILDMLALVPELLSWLADCVVAGTGEPLTAAPKGAEYRTTVAGVALHARWNEHHVTLQLTRKKGAVWPSVVGLEDRQTGELIAAMALPDAVSTTVVFRTNEWARLKPTSQVWRIILRSLRPPVPEE